mgnify:CR=1 FL=1
MTTAKEYLQSILEHALGLIQRAESREIALQLPLLTDDLHQINDKLIEVDEALTDMLLEAASEA